MADAGSCDEEPIDDPEYQVTPPNTQTPRGTSPSSGDKRASSTSTTATSPNKKQRSPTVRVVDTNMQAHNDIAARKINLMPNMLEFGTQDQLDAEHVGVQERESPSFAGHDRAGHPDSL